MNLQTTSVARLKNLALATQRLRLLRECESLESSLIDFVEGAWPYISPAKYQRSWAIDGLCEHLQAVTLGQIKRLLINMPPRTGKTTVTSICWPAWTWARSEQTFWSGNRVRFLCGSYGQKLSFENSNATRRLILSPWYQERWGKNVIIAADQNTKEHFDIAAGGQRIASSVGGSLLGIGGDIIAVDDPHNTEEVESEADRATATMWWNELKTTRLNDPKQSAIVVNMQRLHGEDISGLITRAEDYDEWTHFMVPMEHDVHRHCVTVLKCNEVGEPEEIWEDPRTKENELMWPARFGAKEVHALKIGLGPYMSSGRLQQLPTLAEGGILKETYWQEWPSNEFPAFEFILASADTAYTEKEENDPSACTIWGVFRDANGRPKVMLIWAWRKFLELHGVRIDRKNNEDDKDYFDRTSSKWGLVEWLAYSCKKFKVDLLLVESKASGLSAAQELRRLHGDEGWGIRLVTPEGDKVARAHAVEPAFAQGLVHAPDKDWADLVIEECKEFPKGRFRDLTDSTTQAVKYLRDSGLISHSHEYDAEVYDEMVFKPKMPALYGSVE